MKDNEITLAVYFAENHSPAFSYFGNTSFMPSVSFKLPSIFVAFDEWLSSNNELQIGDSGAKRTF